MITGCPWDGTTGHWWCLDIEERLNFSDEGISICTDVRWRRRNAEIVCTLKRFSENGVVGLLGNRTLSTSMKCREIPFHDLNETIAWRRVIGDTSGTRGRSNDHQWVLGNASAYLTNSSGWARKSASISRNDRRSKMNVGRVIFVKSMDIRAWNKHSFVLRWAVTIREPLTWEIKWEIMVPSIGATKSKSSLNKSRQSEMTNNLLRTLPRRLLRMLHMESGNLLSV